jgi:hypothetical protein
VYDKGGNFVKKPYSPSLSHFFSKINNFIQGFDFKDGVLCIIAFTILTISTLYMSADNSRIYVVKVDNKVIGYINSYEVYKNAVDKIKSDNKNATLNKVIVEKVNKRVNTFITSTTIRNALASEAAPKPGAVAIKVNGTQIVSGIEQGRCTESN